jgi:hypothetical protein
MGDWRRRYETEIGTIGVLRETVRAKQKKKLQGRSTGAERVGGIDVGGI